MVRAARRTGIVLVASVLFGAGWAHAQPVFGDGFESGDLSAWSSFKMSLVVATPYFNWTDLEMVARVYCQSGACPWDPPTQLHDGIDFSPAYDLVPFRSGFDGVVTWIDVYFNPGNGNWQINVLIESLSDSTYRLGYAFEPMSPSVAIKDEQLSEIVVQEGQQVAAGQLIGRLVAPDDSAHVHWGFFVMYEQVCPEPYLADAVRTDLLDLIHRDHPSWNICH